MRVIFLLLIIMVIWRMIKIYQAKRAAAASSAPKELTQQKMVRCDFCSIHLPQAEALQADEKWFCSETHRQRYHQQGN